MRLTALWMGFVLWLLPPSAEGSYALALLTSERAVLVSDSKAWDVSADAAVAGTFRKVDVRAEYAIAMTGSPTAFVAWQGTVPLPGERPRDVVRRLVAAMAPAPAGRESAMVVVRWGASPEFYVAKAVAGPRGWRLERGAYDSRESPASWPAVVGLGWDAHPARKRAVQAEIQARLPGATEAAMVKLAREAVAEAARWSAKVGGMTHVAVLDRAGGRWLTPAPGVAWDGITASVTVQSSRMVIDATGISLVPNGSATFDGNSAFKFTVPDGRAGAFGYDFVSGGTQVRGILQDVAYTLTGSHQVSSGLQASSPSGGNIAAVLATTSGTTSVLSLDTVQGFSTSAGRIDLGGVPNFKGGSSGSAGAIVGYINVLVSGTPARLAVYAP